MNNKRTETSWKKTVSDPVSRNYAKIAKNKANEKSPYGENEPSIHTNFK